MTKAVAEGAYAAAPYVSADTTLDGGYVGKLVRASGNLALTLSPNGFTENQWVDLQNIGTKPISIVSGEGINRADNTTFTLHPDQTSRVVYLGPDPPRWAADSQFAVTLKANQTLAAVAAGDALEGRTETSSIGMDLVLEGDGSAGYWRAPWPGTLTAVEAASRGGSASIQVRKTRGGISAPILGFSAPLRLPTAAAAPFNPEVVTLSGETFAVGDRFTVAVTDFADLLPDPDGIVGIGVSLDVTRIAP
jgi:hypothetical protein